MILSAVVGRHDFVNLCYLEFMILYFCVDIGRTVQNVSNSDCVFP